MVNQVDMSYILLHVDRATVASHKLHHRALKIIKLVVIIQLLSYFRNSTKYEEFNEQSFETQLALEPSDDSDKY